VILENYELWVLFSSAFLSSTLLPGSSEATLIYLLSTSQYSSLSLLLVATLGNTLGGFSSWLLGLIIAKYYPYHQFKKKGHLKALGHIRRWGSPILLLSWLPIIGDPLCLIAGWLKIHWHLALLYILMGKLLRYAAVIWLANFF